MPRSTRSGDAVSLEQLWAGWRLSYIEGADRPEDEQFFRRPEGLTLFEAIFQADLPDEERYVLWTGETCFALLNAFPYTNGHLLVLPQRGVASLEDLTDPEYAELWAGVRAATRAVEVAYSPEGINVGLNLGKGAGAGVPDHLHVHVLPRWGGDTNFMTTVANARVLPESIGESWRRLCDAWPA